MAVFTLGGRETVAVLLKQQVWFLGLGVGLPAWDSVMVPPTGALTDLVSKVGVTRCREQAFVTPKPGGDPALPDDIAMSDGAKFIRSVPATRYLYLYFKLDLADAVPNTLRESGVFFGTTIKAGIPAGQTYIPDADVTAYGKMIQADRFNSIVRDGTIEQSFSTILTL